MSGELFYFRQFNLSLSLFKISGVVFSLIWRQRLIEIQLH